MTAYVHDLNGCAPAPLAHYLKALGILRLVSEQSDPTARGWWEGERFRLLTSLDREGLERFFIEQYQPTPIVAPWNAGTGFYPKDKKAGKAVRGIESISDPRFQQYSAAIKDARKILDGRKESPDKKEKGDFIRRCLRDWRGLHREAMAAAVVLSGDGSPKYPSLLGTGLNDGRLDFSSNFMGRLLELCSLQNTNPMCAKALCRGALWNSQAQGMNKGAIGQFLPGGAGGANSTTGPDGDAVTNHWDFILMLEGSVLFSASATRRLGVTHGGNLVAAPFVVGAQGAGYASAADGDESSRGEQWMPLWSQPMLLEELRHLLAEGRAQVGAKAVKEPLDIARAVARLGVARGINSFQRYGYIERNGQANLAVPLGRFVVPEQVVPQLSCLDDLDAWLSRLRLDARDTSTHKATQRLKLVERRLADAIFSVAQHPQEPARWQSVLLALSGVEAAMVSGSKLKAGAIPKLRPGWVNAGDDGSPEYRLALSLALQASAFSRDNTPYDRVRRHWIAIKNQESAAVIKGRSGIDDAIALVQRRLIESAQRGQRRLPLEAAYHAAASVTDLAALLSGSLDLDRSLALARALMAIDGRAWAKLSRPISCQPAKVTAWPDDAWLAIRLAMLPWPLPDGRHIMVDPAIVRRLASGDAASAVDIALRRLRAVGIRPVVRVGTAPPQVAQLWAAALAFPITRKTAESMLRRLDSNNIQTKQGEKS